MAVHSKGLSYPFSPAWIGRGGGLVGGKGFQALRRVPAPLDAAEVLFRVADLPAAGRAEAGRFVFPELDLAAAMRAGSQEDVFLASSSAGPDPDNDIRA